MISHAQLTSQVPNFFETLTISAYKKNGNCASFGIRTGGAIVFNEDVVTR
jgi:hypothetical protein